MRIGLVGAVWGLVGCGTGADDVFVVASALPKVAVSLPSPFPKKSFIQSTALLLPAQLGTTARQTPS